MVERESKTQSKAINLLRKKGCYVYKNAQNMYTERGRPDLTACVPVRLETLNKLYQPKDTIGLFVGIEMKRPKRIKGTSTAQEVVGRQIQKASGIWFVADNPEIIENFIEKFGG